LRKFAIAGDSQADRVASDPKAIDPDFNSCAGIIGFLASFWAPRIAQQGFDCQCQSARPAATGFEAAALFEDPETDLEERAA
jgi:hypothetical protein